MRQKNKILKSLYLLFLAGSVIGLPCSAQSILEKTLTIDLQKERLDHVLQTLSNKGGVYFSYNSSILRADSLVTLTVREKTLRQILDLLFHGNIEYKENGNYIILRRAPPRAPDKGPNREDKSYIIRGLILDRETGQAIGQASIYDKQGLTATLSDNNGFFRVRVKSPQAELTVSKDLYEDTTIALSRVEPPNLSIYISSATNNRSQVTIGPEYIPQSEPSGIGPPTIAGPQKEPIRVELTPFGKFILSSRLKMQSVNLSHFFIARPVQVSLLPGLSTNGPLNSQITNKFSLNILGGYSAGLSGSELGGLFNIDKKRVRGFQVAGLLNTVGGSVHGFQVAGLLNTVGGSVQGFQAAGLLNTVLDTVEGMQIAGIGNFGQGLRGLQAAGIVNHLRDSLRGLQIAGLFNSAKTVAAGIQISGLVNHTRHLRAGSVQIGLINISDTSEGCSIGLFNFVRTGYRELSIFADEISPLNLAFRSGNLNLYTILILGFNPDPANRLYRFGFGLGHAFPLTGRLSLRPELTSEIVSLSDSIYFNSSSNTHHVGLSPDLMLEKLHLDLYWRPNKRVAFSAGPSLALFINARTTPANGQPYTIPHDMYPHYNFSQNLSAWMGWRVAIHLL